MTTTDEAARTPEPHREPTPITVRKRTRNILVACALLLILFVLWSVPSLITVMVGGGAMALVLSFPVRLLSRVMPRRIAVTVTLLTLVAIVVIGLFILLPPVVNQLREFVQDLPQLADEADDRLRELLADLEENGLVPAESDEIMQDLQQEILQRASRTVENLLTHVLDTITSALGIVVQFLAILFVAVYLLVDAEKFRERFISLPPARYRGDFAELWDDFGESLSRYLGGLVFVSGIQGVIAGVGLLLLGVPYALLLGVWTAMTAVIPYLGSWLGAVPALILAFLESPQTALLVGLLYLVMNTLEGNFLTPRIQGQAVQVHPVVVLFTVLAAGGLFGIMGVVLAIPMLAMVRVLYEFLKLRLRVEG